ncbi:MAG TPA: efflux RND transporter periplasmic adaptor subunit [Gemmatimonadales bacterium]|nr:efflux RND transporter periplasmic adaptor subunit [Gemmatimonadales bacterium]
MTKRIAPAALLAALAALSAGCKPAAPAASPGVQAIELGRENVTVAAAAELKSGPTISGALTAERQATIRAEVNGTVMEVAAEQGQAVSGGQRLARLDDTGIRDAYESAKSLKRSADQAVDLAQRNLERSKSLHDAGAISSRDVEQATWTLTNAQGQQADAEARVASTERQLRKTEVRAPFAGSVSERRVNVGDDVTPGTALFTVVDLGSLRLEASVPSEQLGRLKVGSPVEFTVDGFKGKLFNGKISRINPTVDPSTRQVRITVTVPNDAGRLAAGLFTQGRVATASQSGISVPFTALDERGIQVVVYRLKGGKVERVPVTLGVRDELAERVQVVSGVSEGDTLLLGSAQGISEGSTVRVVGE